jgi:hypothetical protein
MKRGIPMTTLYTKNFAVRRLVAGAATLLFLGTAALAQSGSKGEFTIHNDTEKNTVVGFYTNGGDGWSNNWLNGQMAPGVTATANFTADTGPCEQTFRVGWLGEDGSEVMDDEISINICEASNVYLGDNEITFD